MKFRAALHKTRAECVTYANAINDARVAVAMWCRENRIEMETLDKRLWNLEMDAWKAADEDPAP